ncbi:molybdenum cofactor biosynthesis protein MoaE [Kocuria tytonicola]|uniref:Molybdenum cofactor biosynthesis protein MoaE n=1 Tax=Kocuria tytonicola TaxID=2055946 RepID=A0A3L9LB72_9MICC|nr:molybdenum cofactor biosynthesis protein MoaE [Kocuria tytonicola]RLY95169.1 molybdenum cofactor biosynthesis protein MoaE [Kocuria tytonicola]
MSWSSHRHVGAERPAHRDEVGDYHLVGRRAEVVIVSSSAAAGTAEDRCGPLLRDWLAGRGMQVRVHVVPDGPEVLALLRELTAASRAGYGPRLVVTSGGTGLNSDDVTPEATARVVERESPGIVHALWARGLQKTPTAVMSRGVAGQVGTTFLVNLPGSRGGVKDGMSVLDPLVDHISAQLEDVHGHGQDRSVTRSGEEVVPAAARDAADTADTQAPRATGGAADDAARTAVPDAGTVLHAGVTDDPLDAARAQREVAHPGCGAVVGFSGVIRDHDGGREGVTGLEYSAHPSAGDALRAVVREVAAQHPGTRVWAEHRIGALAVGDSALEVAVAAAHRAEAFAVCSRIVDRIKEGVPIWKRESFRDGQHTWVGLEG